jgi:HAD superfamily hydrolase (TIGR01509 family)
MIKAVIFDCFGVLVTEGWLGFKRKHFADDAQAARKATELLDQADAGLINHEDFIQQVSQLAGVTADEVHSALDVNIANQPLFSYIVGLKPRYKIGFLSNAAANWLGELFTSQQLALFDVINLSFETGVSKPQAGAYQKIAQELGCQVSECVLVDDQVRHCEGAKSAGMRAILYQDFPQLKRDLDKVLANSKS